MPPSKALPVHVRDRVFSAYKRATVLEDNNYKAWHCWAMVSAFERNVPGRSMSVSHIASGPVCLVKISKYRSIEMSAILLGSNIVLHR